MIAAMFRAGVAVCLLAGVAHADYPPVTNRDYAIELYSGVPIGNAATIAMGGAAAANAMGTSGTLINPSAPAVRPTTDPDDWSLDAHFDVLTGTSSSDYDNNGSTKEGGTSLVTVGLGGRAHDWGLAITATYSNSELDSTALVAQALQGKIALAKWLPERDLAIGLALDIASFGLQANCKNFDVTCTWVFTISGGGIEAGATWVPAYQNFRVGGAIATGISNSDVTASTCPDPANCEGYILPNQVVAPGHGVLGFSYRFAETAWNQLVGGTFRDEPSLTLVADLAITASTNGAYGLEAFGDKELQPTGHRWAFSPRAGAEWECLPGRLRLRAGSYFEPERFDGVHGRVHATFGVQLRWLEFHAWGRRRGSITLTGDVAERFGNVGFSIGFWH